MIVNPYGTAARWTAGIEQVAYAEREISADIRDNLIHLVEHIARIALLNRSSIDVKMKAKVLNGLYLIQRNERPECGCTVKSLAKIPWKALLPQSTLQFTSREINAHRHRIVVSGGKSYGNSLAQFADAHHQFGFIFDASEVVGDKERLAVFQQSSIAFGENDGVL